MKNHIKLQNVVAACIVTLAVGTTGTFSRAESATARENLEKLKETNSCRGCDLSGLTINRTNLSGADLEGADFSRTKFFLSNLSGANLRNANLKGASFGGTDLGEADLRGADLRGTSLEGAYLEETKLDGEFVTAKPYEAIGVLDVEKQVYVPNPEKPKKSPETRDVKVAARRDLEESPPMAVEQEAKPPSGKKADTADQVKMTADGQQPGAPAAKKAVPVRQAIVEPQEPAGEQVEAEPVGVPEPVTAKAVASDTGIGKSSSTPDSMPKKMAEARKLPPVPPAEVKIDEVQAVKTPEKTMDGESGVNLATGKSKRDRLTRLLDEDKCLGCDLSGLDLSGKNLKNVDLERANLSGCNLERVILDKANLKGAILQNAVLRMASLKNADLYKADLSGADLSGANMQGAKLDNAKLSTVVGLGTVDK